MTKTYKFLDMQSGEMGEVLAASWDEAHRLIIDLLVSMYGWTHNGKPLGYKPKYY